MYRKAAACSLNIDFSTWNNLLVFAFHSNSKSWFRCAISRVKIRKFALLFILLLINNGPFIFLGCWVTKLQQFKHFVYREKYPLLLMSGFQGGPVCLWKANTIWNVWQSAVATARSRDTWGGWLFMQHFLVKEGFCSSTLCVCEQYTHTEFAFDVCV